MRRGAFADGSRPGAVRRALLVILSTALVAALLVVVSAVTRRDGTGPLLPAADPAAPGRLAYAAGGDHRSLQLAPDATTFTALLATGDAGEDCQPAVQGDTVVWVSDRSGTGEQLMRRQGGGPAVPLFDRPGWRIKHPAISPDGTMVAFTSWSESGPGWDWCHQSQVDGWSEPPASPPDSTPSVWLIRTDGTGLRRVVAGAGWASWSPDGGSLAFERAARIWRVPVAEGGKPVRLDTGTAAAHRPAWAPAGAPGGDRIAYVAVGDDKRLTLATVPSGGGAVQVLAKTPASVGTSVNIDAAWSPDGRTLAFLAGSVYRVDAARGCAGCPGDLAANGGRAPLESVAWYRPPGSAAAVPLVTSVVRSYRHLESVHPAQPLDRIDLQPRDLDGRTGYRDPAYSPDGRRLAYVAIRRSGDARGRAQIMVGDAADPSQAVALGGPDVDDSTDQSRPAWSPDGTRLAFTQTPRIEGTVRASVSVVDISAGVAQAKALFTVPGLTAPSPLICGTDDRDPTWSADGSRIAVSRAGACLVPFLKAPQGDSIYDIRHIWSVSASDGSDQHDLTEAQCGHACKVADERPAFSPNGHELAVARTLLNRQPVPIPQPRAPSADAAPYSVLVVLAGDGRSCRMVVPTTGGCPQWLPDGGRPKSDFWQPGSPAWSPDGRRLAFDTEVPYGDGTSVALGVADAATGVGTVLPARVGTSQQSATWQPTADLAVTLTADRPTAALGDTVVLNLAVTNLGPARAVRTKAQLALPAGLVATGPAQPSQGACTTALDCDLGVLASGGTATVRQSVRAAALGSQLATATADSALPDPRPDNNRAQVAVTVVAPKLPDVAVTAQVVPPTVHVNEPATVEFTVRNQGAATAYGVRFYPVVPPGLHVIAANPACPAAGCLLGDLVVGAEAKVTLQVSSPTPLTATVIGTAEVGQGGDSDPTNNTATATVTVLGHEPPRLRADPAVTLALDPATAYVGGTTTARFTVRNLGQAKATGITLTAALPPGAALTGAPPGCAPANCPIGDLDPGAATTVALVLQPTAAFTGPVVGTITTTGDDERTDNDVAIAQLTVLQPVVVLDPVIGPPGIVTVAHGSQFPPGAQLRLHWSAGVTAAAAPVVVAADGSFTAQMLVMVQDTIGARELIVRPAAAGPPAFGEVRTGFRVVPGVLQPNLFERRR